MKYVYRKYNRDNWKRWDMRESRRAWEERNKKRDIYREWRK